jgi:hypothetical protein
MLLEDRLRARELGQIAAAISAVEKLAKLHGLMVHRREIGSPGLFEDMDPNERQQLLEAIDEELARRQRSDA